MASGTVEPTQPMTQPEPQAPAPPTPFEILMARLDTVDKRLDQQATATVKILEIITSPQAQQPAQAQGLMGILDKALDKFGDELKTGASGEDAMYTRIGKSVFDGALDGTIKRVIKAAGTEGAKHVTGLG